jgi:hypothetical protein
MAICSYEPSHRYDFEWDCPNFEINHAMFQSAIINIQPNTLNSYKIQLLRKNTSDQLALLSQIDFTALKNNLLPEYYRIRNHYAHHPLLFLIYILGLISITDAYHRVREKLTKSHFSTIDKHTKGLTAVDIPLCVALAGMAYINYSYNQIPVIKTMHHLKELEKIYQEIAQRS